MHSLQILAESNRAVDCLEEVANTLLDRSTVIDKDSALLDAFFYDSATATNSAPPSLSTVSRENTSEVPAQAIAHKKGCDNRFATIYPAAKRKRSEVFVSDPQDHRFGKLQRSTVDRIMEIFPSTAKWSDIEALIPTFITGHQICDQDQWERNNLASLCRRIVLGDRKQQVQTFQNMLFCIQLTAKVQR